MTTSKIVIPEEYNTDALRQGYWGEQWVKHFYENSGKFWVHSNEDRFGSWDQTVISKKTGISRLQQIKTISRYVTKNYFGITLGQRGDTYEAIQAADDLIFVVRTPPTFYDNLYEGHVLLVKNHRQYKQNKNQLIIPSYKENFEKIGELTPSELNEVNQFNP